MLTYRMVFVVLYLMILEDIKTYLYNTKERLIRQHEVMFDNLLARHTTALMHYRMRVWCRARRSPTHLIAVGEEVAISIAANELAKLALGLYGRHPAVRIHITVLPWPHQVLVSVGDSIGIIVHGGVSLPSFRLLTSVQWDSSALVVVSPLAWHVLQNQAGMSLSKSSATVTLCRWLSRARTDSYVPPAMIALFCTAPCTCETDRSPYALPLSVAIKLLVLTRVLPTSRV